MKRHLTPEEHVDALDDVLTGTRAAHLASCGECQADAATLRRMRREAGDVAAPPPSPLFWDHFSERVRVAVSEQPVPSRRWWQDWRRAGAMAVAGSLVVVLFVLVPGAPDETGTGQTGEAEGPETVALSGDDDPSWALVVGLTDGIDLGLDDARDAMAPRAGTADAMLDDLTAEQRETLVRLLEKEMGESD
jgi:hypothetical protein